jgi:osmotically-inducible protein OsmY
MWAMCRWGLLLTAGLTWCGTERTVAQSMEWPAQRQNNAPGAKTPAAPREDVHAAAARIELAWLADATTFPYGLEAIAQNGRIEIRGFVPSNQIHKHAAKVARQITRLPVQDSLREHGGLSGAPVRLPAQQLHTAAATALYEACPRQALSIRIRCDTDGTVTIQGAVASLEQQLALSRALHHVPGCTRVDNLTALSGAQGPVPAVTAAVPTFAPKPAAPIQQATHTAPAPAQPTGAYETRGLVYVEPKPVAPIQQASYTAPAAAQPTGAYETRGVVILEEPAVIPAGVAKNFQAAPPLPAPAPPVPPPPPPPAPPVSPPLPPVNDPRAEQLARLVIAACPQARDVRVVLTGSSEISLELTARSREESTALRDRIYAIRALDPYALVLKINVP